MRPIVHLHCVTFPQLKRKKSPLKCVGWRPASSLLKQALGTAGRTAAAWRKGEWAERQSRVTPPPPPPKEAGPALS